MTVTLDALARPNGTFLMVAMDQRESLRGMLAEHHPEAIEDDRLVRFKLAVARELGQHASGFLIDRRFGFDEVVRQRLLPESCGLVLAADAMSVLAGVVRPARGKDGFDREAAIVEAARELAALGPSLYKVEVPLHGGGDPAELAGRCREIDEAVDCPWVVLSSGVEPDDFPAAVEAACRAGASGILAGRALWRGTLGADDPTFLLRQHSAPRLERLGAIVDAHGRPWSE